MAATQQEIEAYIRQAAAARGIDPDIAIRAANTEGGTREEARRGTFATGSSWWPFQLHYGGRGYEHFGTTAGMGNSFTARTGWQPGDPNAWRASVDYALDEVAQNGWNKFYGPPTVGITGRTGVSQDAHPLGVDPVNLPSGIKVSARPLTDLGKEDVASPTVIHDVVDKPVKVAGFASGEIERIVTLNNGTRYHYFYGEDSPPASPETVKGTEFDPANFGSVGPNGETIGLRLGGIDMDGARARAWATENKPQAATIATEKVPQDDGSTIVYNRNTKTGERTVALDPNGAPIIIPPKAGRTAAQTAADDARAEASRAQAELARARTAQVGLPAPRSASQTEADIALAGERRAQTIKAQTQAAAAAQKMLPQVQVLLAQQAQTMQYIHDGIADGTYTLEQANGYYNAAQEYYAAALRGSTPAAEEKARQEQVTRRADIGKDILNERVRGGTALAGSLFRDYQQLLTPTKGGGPLVAPPQGFDLFQYTKSLTDELGGGQEMSDLAKALLAATNPATGPAVGPRVPVLAGAGAPSVDAVLNPEAEPAE